MSRFNSMLLCGKIILKNFSKSINHCKVRDHCHYKGKYRGVAHSICNLEFNAPNEFPVGFHNSSNYDYHFIIKELANVFEGKFECLGENTEKYKTFFVPIEKEVTKIYKDGNLSIVQDLWQAHYQILLIISQKEFANLNVNIAIVLLNMKVSRTI